jgi:DNA-binding NtrC family response regulator
VRQGKFRPDLLYRLKVLYIFISPLRDRRQDIPLLATTFLEQLNSANQTRKYFGPSVVSKLGAGDYAGNVRELQNVVERAFYSTRSAVITQVETLEPELATSYEAESWFRELTEGKQDFWRAVHDAYKRRDLPREKVIALVDYGLRTTRGNYKAMAVKFHLPKEEYRRFMDFLRRSKCLLDFRPYRRIGEI